MSEWSQSIVFDEEFLRKLDSKSMNVPTTPKNPLPRSKTTEITPVNRDRDETVNNSLEIIEESPTNDGINKTSVHQSIRERLKNATIARKQVLKRNKSDSVLQASKVVDLTPCPILPPPPPPPLFEEESLSKYFQSQFDVPECSMFNPKIDEVRDENMINLSKLLSSDFLCDVDEGAKDTILSSTNFDDVLKDSVVFEVDLPNISADDSMALIFSEKLLDKPISDDFSFHESEDRDQINDIDNMSYIQLPNNDLENSLFIENEMESQKEFLKSVLKSEEFEDDGFKAPLVINSLKYNKSDANKSLIIDTTKNLLLISNWNLPTAVVNEYRKKCVVEMFSWQCECLKNSKVS